MNRNTRRRSDLLNLLKDEGFVTIREMASRAGVTEMTIRRDLQQLDSEQLVRLLPGGVILRSALAVEKEQPYSLISESCVNQEAKKRIGKKAAELVEANDLIIIDSGTTTEYLARNIPDDMPLTVMCNTLNILLEVHRRKSCKIILAGGYYHENTMMFDSSEGLELIRRVRAQKAFIGATGVSDRLGVTCSNQIEPNVKRAIIGSSVEKILMVDSNKFGLVKSSYFAELDEFDTVITDSGIPPAYHDLIERLGKRLIVV